LVISILVKNFRDPCQGSVHEVASRIIYRYGFGRVTGKYR